MTTTVRFTTESGSYTIPVSDTDRIGKLFAPDELLGKVMKATVEYSDGTTATFERIEDTK